ncbi:MAG: hypothetical protein IVW57_01435 [Ktedonobacterales bacterium]|nr:hypothetical protein [Ktedonobacterales bacterium]
MSTTYYRNLFLRQWWLIAACVFGIGAGAFITSRFIATPASSYLSSALVEADVNGSFTDLTGYLATEARLATSTRITAAVATSNPGTTVGQIGTETTATVITGTHLIQISVTDTHADHAAKLANDIANALVSQQQQDAQQRGAQGLQQIQSQINNTQNQINQVTENLNRALQSNNQGQISDLEAQLSSLREQHTLLQFTLAQMQLSQSQGVPNLVLAEPAQPSTAPTRALISPSAKLTLAGIILGFAIGLALVLLLDLIARRNDIAASLQAVSTTETPGGGQHTNMASRTGKTP